jgi:type VI secretion system protein ImpG
MQTNKLKSYINKVRNAIYQFEQENNVPIINNPHVGILIEAFAHINAKLDIILEDQQDRLAKQVLDLFYPHYNKPYPATIIAQFASKAESVFFMPKGTLFSALYNKHAVTFSTCYDIELIPGIIKKISFNKCEETIFNQKSESFVEITIQTKQKFEDCSINKLQFYINNAHNSGYLVYKNIYTSCCGIAIVDPESQENICFLDKSCLKNLAFNQQASILPEYNNSFLGYQVISEFFFLPEKYLFFALDLHDVPKAKLGNQFSIKIYFTNQSLKNNIHHDIFIINCLPAINLFFKQSDPIEIQPENVEYTVDINKQKPNQYEIYEIKEVAIELNNKTLHANPILQAYKEEDYDKGVFWTLKTCDSEGKHLQHHISLITKNETIIKQARCFFVTANVFEKDAPAWLFANYASEIKLELVKPTMPIEKIQCIKLPTMPLYKDVNTNYVILSHLHLNYFNIFIENDAEKLLQGLLSAYYIQNSCEDNKLLINAIKKVSITSCIDKIQVDAYNKQFCRGFKVKILLEDNEFLPPGLIHIFSQMLKQFFKHYAPINSFIKTEIEIN